MSDGAFEIGLTMSGAVSAGAYSAGVLDFLVQALDAWETARQNPDLADRIPNHRVSIKVITGASAGAITGALGVVGLAQALTRTQRPTSVRQTVNCVLPCLYDAWVVKPALVSSTGGADFLQTDDLDKQQNVVSLLNCKLLDDIRGDALKVVSRNSAPLPYIAQKLHVYLTLTNLRGIPYEVPFEGGTFGMMAHGDRVHYTINDLGGYSSPSPFADRDPTRSLSINALFGAAPGTDWQQFTYAAVASGGFPVGLEPRLISTVLPEYEDRSWPLEEWKLDDEIHPAWPSPWSNQTTRKFEFLSVDGGVVNNDPFDYAHFTLMQDPPTPNPRDGEDADRAVIMIDPFPAPPAFLPDGEPDTAIVSVLKALFPAMLNQARFKPSELILAASEAVFSRYLIAPSRTNAANIEAPYPIACGLLSGFGGFLSKNFREHDFILGQRNCQKFLMTSFALPVYNKIVQQWPAAVRTDPAFVAETADAVGPPNPGPPHYCIIPLLGDAKQPIELPPWPQMSQNDFDTLQDRIKQRLDAVAKKLIATQGPGGFLDAVLGWVYSQNSQKALDFVRFTILADLVKRDQIQNWALPAQWKQPPAQELDGDAVRNVLAALLNPSFDLRNVAGISSATGLDVTTVNAILAACQAQTGAPYEVWQTPQKDRAGNSLYALTSRKQSFLASLPLVRQVRQWAWPLRVDKPGL